MEPDEYISSFFSHMKSQLRDTAVQPDGKSAKYRKLVVSALWSNQLWDVELKNGGSTEPIRRQYDPANARSAESAANYFVDALLRETGQEPVPRPEPVGRHYHAGRPKAATRV